ncbi:MAG: pilus assembly protein TadG-related protein [Sporichthyaceae bacterium]
MAPRLAPTPNLPGPTRRGPLASPLAARGADTCDEGSITPFVVVLTAALLAMAGLVVDGGYALAARQDAAATAEQAARAGADALSRQSFLRGGPLRIDRAAAAAAAERHLAVVGHAGQASISGDTVTVTVQVTRTTAILSAIGIETLTASATASARGLTGIDHEEDLPPITTSGEGPR